MKKNFIIFIITAIVVFPFVHTLSAQEKTKLKKISLIYSDHSPPNSGGARFFKDKYLPKIQNGLAKIGYELDITYHHSESLYKYSDQVQACETGLIDITLLTLDYETERAPLHEVLIMPLLGFNEYSSSRAWFELQENITEFGAELSAFKELIHFIALPTVFNLNKEARVPEDFKGLKIVSDAMIADMFRSIGATPVTPYIADLKPSLENNLIDGIALGISGITLFDLQDLVKVHIFPTGDSLGHTGTSFIMNREKYEKLPPEVQKVIDDNVMWASEKLNEIEVNNIPENIKICRDKGNKIINLTKNEMDEWYKAIKPLHEQWIKKMESMDLPGQKVYDEARRLAQKYKNQK